MTGVEPRTGVHYFRIEKAEDRRRADNRPVCTALAQYTLLHGKDLLTNRGLFYDTISCICIHSEKCDLHAHPGVDLRISNGYLVSVALALIQVQP